MNYCSKDVQILGISKKKTNNPVVIDAFVRYMAGSADDVLVRKSFRVSLISIMISRCGADLGGVWLGQQVMAARKPFKLRAFTMAHNLAMTLLSLYMAVEMVTQARLLSSVSNSSKPSIAG